jgi:hypothetical protein
MSISQIKLSKRNFPTLFENFYSVIFVYYLPVMKKNDKLSTYFIMSGLVKDKTSANTLNTAT